MTRREHMLAVFEGRDVERPPVSVRLDLWHRDAESRGALPAEVRGLEQEEVEDYLGFARAARFRGKPQIELDGCEVRSRREGDDVIEEWVFPERALTKVKRTPPENARRGLAAYTLKYPLKSLADYECLTQAMGRARAVVDEEGFRRLDRETGDRGLPMFIVPACPMHLIMLDYAGYESFYFHLTDFPEAVEALAAAIEKAYRRDVWPALEASRARLILHGSHFSSQMTPLPIFERYFAPYFQDFNQRMHRAGKLVCWHSDAPIGTLLDHVLAAGFDGADCLATPPLVDEDLDVYFAAWRGRIKCWGGLPSVLFDPTYPLADYKAHVRRVVDETRGRNDFIFGASDNVMPGAEWERLVYLARAAGTRE